MAKLRYIPLDEYIPELTGPRFVLQDPSKPYDFVTNRRIDSPEYTTAIQALRDQGRIIDGYMCPAPIDCPYAHPGTPEVRTGYMFNPEDFDASNDGDCVHFLTVDTLAKLLIRTLYQCPGGSIGLEIDYCEVVVEIEEGGDVER